MAPKLLNALLLILMIHIIDGASVADYIDINQYTSVYYNPKTGVGLKAALEDSGREPLTSPKIAFRGLPCHCENLSCGCCAGVNITAFNFDRRACSTFTYDPYEFSIAMAVTMNEREVYTNSISAKNPPPLCFPAPYIPAVSFCVRFFDIHTPGRNLYACIDFETRVVGSPILILHFDCVKLGADGISWHKPGDDLNSQTNPEVSEPDVYDEVNFEEQDVAPVTNSGTTLSPEQEDEIGQLKLKSPGKSFLFV